MTPTIEIQSVGNNVGNADPISNWSSAVTASLGDWVVLLAFSGLDSNFAGTTKSWNGLTPTVSVISDSGSVSVKTAIFAIPVGSGSAGAVTPVWDPPDNQPTRVYVAVVSGAGPTLGDSGSIRDNNHENTAQSIPLTVASSSLSICIGAKDDPEQGGSLNTPTIGGGFDELIASASTGTGVNNVTVDAVKGTGVTNFNPTFTWPAAPLRNWSLSALEFPAASSASVAIVDPGQLDAQAGYAEALAMDSTNWTDETWSVSGLPTGSSLVDNADGTAEVVMTNSVLSGSYSLDFTLGTAELTTNLVVAPAPIATGSTDVSGSAEFTILWGAGAPSGTVHTFRVDVGGESITGSFTKPS